MIRKFSMSFMAALIFSGVVVARSGDDSTKPGIVHWEMQGDLSETCSCAVPCTCNFGQGPSPHHYCHTIFSLDIQKGYYGDVKLDGLHLAGVHGNKSKVWYIDASANPEQAAALRQIAEHILKSEHYVSAPITQKVGDEGNKVEIAGKGGFEAEYIMGLDKKTPVVVENNTTWNIPRSIKGKTTSVRYKDEFGNKFEFRGTNSNQGKFDWSDQTERYF